MTRCPPDCDCTADCEAPSPTVSSPSCVAEPGTVFPDAAEDQSSDGLGRVRYRDYDIYPTDPVPPIPGWQQFAWTFAHKDYDGPEDGRCGHAPGLAECKAEIDEREGGPPEGWQKAQAAKCPCQGADDYCQCINEYWPERYGLQETEKCEDCGLPASALLHRHCRRDECPVRAALALTTPEGK